MDNETRLSDSAEELDIDIATVTTAIRLTEARNIVKNNVITSMVTGLIPVPLLDIVSLSNIQFHMIQSLAEHYETPSDNIKKSLFTSLISGALPVASLIGLGSIVKSIPGIGTLAGSGSVSVASGAVTYALGQVFIRHFELGGSLEDFNPDSAKDFFREEVKNGKEIAKEILDEIKNNKRGAIDTEQGENS